MEHLSLLAGGQEHSVTDWEREAAAVLRKSGRLTTEQPDSLVWDKLSRTTLDGIVITPLGVPGPEEGTGEDTDDSRGDVHTRGIAAPEKVSRAAGWDIRAHLGDPDAVRAAQDILVDLENGATSLWLSLGRGGMDVDDLGKVLEKVYVDLAPVVLDAPDAPVEAAQAFAALLKERAVEPAKGTNLGGDPIGAGLRGFECSVSEIVPSLADLARQTGTKALVVDATAVHDAGATDAQELGYSLAVGVAYLRALVATGLSAAEAAELVEFRYAATVEQFPTIAKLRAARSLWARVLELSDVSDPGIQVQHAVTSRPMMTKYDPYVNMLRCTVAAFAAGVGGAASVTVLPFDQPLGLPDAFSRRIARNTSSLLISEAHIAKVVDPAGGSFMVERLTDDLAVAGWTEFQAVEAEGGIQESLALEQGGLLDRIKERGLKPRLAAIRTRKAPITGLTEFPNLGETLPERRPTPERAVQADRYGIEFEVLRDTPAGTPVFLATLGSIAAHTARATFASNLFAAGGIDTVAAGATEGPVELLAGYAGQPVVCLCGDDPSYAEWGAQAVQALREAGARYVVLAGKPGERTVPAELVDAYAAIGIDALAFLRGVREELAK